jgi:sugar lactone lactonase YvrE
LAGGTPGYKDGVGDKAQFTFPNGITIDQKTGTLFVSDYDNHTIRKITPQGLSHFFAYILNRKILCTV